MLTVILFFLACVGMPFFFLSFYGSAEDFKENRRKKVLILFGALIFVLAIVFPPAWLLVAFFILCWILKLMWRSVLGGIVFVVISFILAIYTYKFSNVLNNIIEKNFGDVKAIKLLVSSLMLFLLLIGIVHLFFSVVLIIKKKNLKNDENQVVVVSDEFGKKLKNLEKKIIIFIAICVALLGILEFLS